MSKHTPGPWGIEYDNGDEAGDGQWYNVGPVKVWFSYRATSEQQGRARADASLISAAPDLLAACKAVVETDGFVGSAIMRGRIDDMKAAIAIAEGGGS